MQETIVELPTPVQPIAVYSPELLVTESSLTGEPVAALLVSPPLKRLEDMTQLAGIRKPRRAILNALADYYYLTADQLTRLLFSEGSLTYVQTQLRELVAEALVEKTLPPKQTVYGRSPFVYRLSRKGRLLAKNLGIAVPKRYRSLAESTHKSYPLSHILAVNEFLIKTTLLAKRNVDIVLRQTLHDKVLSQHPLRVTLPGEQKTRKLIPDSWIDIGQKSLLRRYCFCVEVNLTEVSQRRWRETVSKYLSCLPAYQAYFETDIITVLVSIQSPTAFPIMLRDTLSAAEKEERLLEEQHRVLRRQNFLQWTDTESG